MNLTPASTLKIYTTSCALELLGSDFRYSTYLEHDGYIDECGVLHGNIYITGTGDPTLGSDRFEDSYNYAQIINLFGEEIENGELPADLEWTGKIIQDICYHNASNYFNWKEAPQPATVESV